ncbi:KICSTOR complex protein SZT2-like isoform X2 [Cimex lectularius]|uniref:KICSTOR complex protein SZT2 n=1 Tax=Cimex lectularius TaxID=79782 RepID=A0A8I6RMF1_CIMLE|nr:KICSTOR complex protein SZT2-like isoform X2 [Cimex lectularius]
MGEHEESPGVLVASVVYALMNQGYHVSRNVRTQWFFKHLNKKINLQPISDITQDCEIQILSVYPQDPPSDWGPENSLSYQYLITTSTNVVYLSKVSKAVYCLDLSPSISAVDIQHGQVMLDEIVSAVRHSIEGVVKPFYVPGTDIIFEPDLFVTVIVHTPFFTTPAQQVLVQGWRVTAENVEEFLSAIIKQLELLEDTIADVSALVHDEIESLRQKQAESERLVGGLFEEVNDKQPGLPPGISMVSPDSGFINLLRYGMLALRLLPSSNLSNLIVVTDGMITLPDIHVLDSVLTQLRSNAVAVSFLHVGSQFHPHSSHGLVPYSELMQFIASATLGAYIPSPYLYSQDKSIDIYQEAFITWSFRRKAVQEFSTPTPRHGDWNISNQGFYGNREPQLLVKKQSEDHLNASLTSILCCRLHEGYMIKNVHLRGNDLEVTMMLPWSNHIYLEYIITSEWPPVAAKNLVHYVLSIKAPYEFLHDITCLMKKPFQSPYRQAVVSRFWCTLKTLSHTDILLSHLDSFSENTMAYTIPDSIRNGMPLFYLPSSSSPPELSSSGSSCPQFAQFWRPVVVLEPSVWQKWLHTHRLGLILQPDRPLPNSLHTVANNPRVHVLQCRQAEAALYCSLKKLTTFVLIENHSYIKIMPTDNEKGPNWFYIVRVTSKPPCAVIHIAFLGGTPGNLRHQVVETIKEEISNLKIPQRADMRKYDPIDTQLRSEVECCTVIQKPLEKILIRYERMPCEFGTVVFPDGTQPISAAKPLRPSSTLITTLSRYLHHKRSIWDAHTPSASHNNMLPTMLTTLTRMRLQEGFRFAHCSAGIINMVLEVQMKCFDDDTPNTNTGQIQPCIIQYVLFPPHLTSSSMKGRINKNNEEATSGLLIFDQIFQETSRDKFGSSSNSGDEGGDELENEQRTELITECWIEPQHGIVTGSPSNRTYMENLHYHQIADMIWRVDAECISNLLTFDHLQLMCHNQQITPPLALDPSSLHHNPLENWPHAVAIEDKRIHRIPFAYNLLNLLPKCQQAELLSPVFIQELSDVWNNKSRTDAPNNLLMENLLTQLQELHHRELHLTEHESSQLMQLIIKRARDVGKHPVPFPSGVNKFDGRKVSDTESTDTCETVPAASDWARMISWAMYASEVTTPPQGSTDDIKTSKQNSKNHLCDGKKQKVYIPKWRCFVKSMASTHCVLTFIPASFQDLKALMLGSDIKMYKLYETTEKKLNDSKEFYNRVPESSSNHESSEHFQQTSSVSDVEYSDLMSFSKASSKIDLQFSEEDLVFESVSSKKGNLKEMLEPFRLRSSSWDPMKKNSDSIKVDNKRVRTSSVGAKMKPIGFQKRLLTNDGDDFAKYCNKKDENYKPCFGALTLPIYVYDCPLSNLVDALIFKSSFERRNDIFQNKSTKSEPEHLINKMDSETTPDDLDLQHHCKVITQAFNKAFVEALFKSLHSNHKICSIDIQSAVDECEETLLEIDITKYMQTVCGHCKHLLKEDMLVANSSQFIPSTCLPPELFPLHKLIKQRFLEILTVCFKSVPTSPEYFFCCPPVQISRLADVGLDISSHRIDTQEFDGITLQSIDFSSNQNSMIGGWDRLAFESTQDDARTSLLSNMDSDSVSDYLNEASDELFPLFLHLVCSIRSTDKTKLITSPVKIIPTCLGELIGDIKRLEPFDLAKTTISLDMYCLTLPPAYPADLPPGNLSTHLMQDVLGTSLVHQESAQTTDQHFVNEGLKSNDKLQHLPIQQNKAVNKCIIEIEWFLQDEIAVFLLDSCPVNESTLNFVANHVISSDGRRYSCIQNTVGLNFVFGPEHSLERFIKEFAQMKITGYCLKQENDFYYLVKSQETGENQKDFYPFGNTHMHDDFRSYFCSAKNLAEVNKSEWTEMDSKAFSTKLSVRWIKELNQYRSTMPNFWLILKIYEEKVTCYFHCRFLEIDSEEVQQYKYIHQNVLENIESVCKIVNQTLLLNSLHETRMCDVLLQPETADDLWNPNQSLPFLKTLEDGVDIDMRGSYAETTQKFRPGSFSCPVVWQTHLTLHPRLKTGPGKPGLSRAIQALRTVLNRFSVNNRTNMFVYQDNSGSNVFYLRLHENIKNSSKTIEEENSPGPVSRSSSINSLTNKKQHDDSLAKDYRPRLKSFGESIDSLVSKQEELTLKVHGIAPAGAEITNELVQVLHNRLDDAVLEVVSVMLARNPMCKLSPDDVHFIQKPNHKADSITQFTIPKYAHHSLEALIFYIRQNLLQFLFLPKYIDNRFQFQDYSQPEGSPKRISENNIYLYNQSPVSGNKGIACLAVSLVDVKGNILCEGECNKPINIFCENQPLHPGIFHEITCTEVFDSSCDNTESSDVLMEVRLWKKGRVNMELLIQKLKGIVQFSLWDLLMEYHLLNTPLKEKCIDKTTGEESEVMNKLFYKEIPGWLQYGHELNVPAVKTHTIKLTTRHAVTITLREIKNLIQLHEPITHVFYENSEKTGAITYNGDYEIPSISTCYLISGNASFYTNQLHTEQRCSMDSDIKNTVVLQKFSAYVSPVHEGNQFVPRHRFLIAVITNEQVIVYMYNWSKDRVENLTKLLTQLGLWLSARSNFLIGILTQKMGLFHNQPCLRKSTPQLTCMDGTEFESLLNFTPASTPRKIPSANMTSITQILRDSDPIIKKSTSNDPVVSSIYQVMDIRSKDKREQQDKLHMMWQSRGVTPYIPLSEHTLELFLSYSRSIHYCLTPLLFHPKWRLESAATRDNSLLLNTSSMRILDYSVDLRWHQAICSNFVNEYKQYLQTLGYIPVQTAPSTPRKIGKCAQPDESTKCYLQKSLLGGIIMLEISLLEPFFQVKLHAIEYSRLQPKPTTSWLPQILLNFLDECERVKVLIHLHSFTYDFHLRCLQCYISGDPSPLTRDYHLTSFLDDFLKYYPKAPNFARSLASCGSLCISNLSTPPLQLFHYLLSHEKDYDMEVVRMLPYESNVDPDYSSRENEFILIKQSITPKKDMGEGKQIDEFKVISIVALEKSSIKTVIKLNYYVILTPGRDLYPKPDNEWSLGKFCTVSTTNHLVYSKLCSSTQSSDTYLDCIPQQEFETGETDDAYLIRRESVNYLGYYSSHEQLMQQLMKLESLKVQKHIEMMVNKGSIDCQIHLLWNKLLSNPSSNSLTYCELFELRDLAYIQKMLDMDKRLNPMLLQPFTWYQGLMKILMSKYADKCKVFVSPDSFTQHLLILHPRFLEGFVMLTLDSANSFGELSIVFRHPYKCDVSAEDIHNLIEGVVNACCYHLWMNLLI